MAGDFSAVRCLLYTAGACLQAANKITRLEGLDKLVHLATLHLRDNQIDTLDGFAPEMKNLQYVNLRCAHGSVTR